MEKPTGNFFLSTKLDKSGKYVVSRVQDDVTNGGTTHLYVKRLKGDEIQWKVEVGTIINGKTSNTQGFWGIEATHVEVMIKEFDDRRKSGELADLNSTCDKIGE